MAAVGTDEDMLALGPVLHVVGVGQTAVVPQHASRLVTVVAADAVDGNRAEVAADIELDPTAGGAEVVAVALAQTQRLEGSGPAGEVDIVRALVIVEGMLQTYPVGTRVAVHVVDSIAAVGGEQIGAYGAVRHAGAAQQHHVRHGHSDTDETQNSHANHSGQTVVGVRSGLDLLPHLILAGPAPRSDGGLPLIGQSHVAGRIVRPGLRPW